MKRLAVLLVLLAPVGVIAGEGRRPMKVDDMFRFQRVSDPQISPDGRTVVWAQGEVDLKANRVRTSLWLAPADGSGPPRRLTNAEKSDSHPRWSPDGKRILFESSRSGSLQLWVIDAGGGEARRLTNLSTGASDGIWSRDGRHIAFVSTVWPEYSDKPFKQSDALNRKRIEAAEKNPVKVKVFTRLFFRHWDEYVEDKRQHLFVMSFNDEKAGEPRDVTPGDRDASPTSSTFSSGVDFTFSPDGKYLVFTAVPEKNEAWNTNYDLCRVPVTGGMARWECLTKDNRAADGGPQFSPDGKTLAYRAQRRAGFEADRWELMTVPCGPDGAPQGKPRSVTPKWDRAVGDFAWQQNGSVVLVAEENARTSLFTLSLTGEAEPRELIRGGMVLSVSISRGGKVAAYALARMDRPAEVYTRTLGADAKPRQVSHANDELLARLDVPRPESVTVKGAGGTPMQMWILKPPGFDPAKKWPLVYLVHGGPQGAWEDGWSNRWNPALWAAQGYVVALPNPRGSTGFGQKYVDEISGDWGGKVYEDLMAGLAYLEKRPYIDTQRMAAAGASFGGYMMNWFAVNTGKFKTLITHCGVWNFDSMYASTEELWFDEWEHGGPPWGKNRESYEKHSPHRKAANLGTFRTPMLVIHNDLDFRVPVSEGIQLFTSLQRQGVTARMLNFPDEGHWVLKPRNSRRWHQEVFSWLAKYAPPGGR